MALLGSRKAKKSHEDRRVRREQTANVVRSVVERSGGSEEEIRRAGQLAAKQYQRYQMDPAAQRSYQAFYAEHGTEAAAVLGAASVVGAAIHPALGAALAASAAVAKTQAAQEIRLANARLAEKEELSTLLNSLGEVRQADSDSARPEEGSTAAPDLETIIDEPSQIAAAIAPGWRGWMQAALASLQTDWARAQATLTVMRQAITSRLAL
jgi:hypothetical protein